MEVRTNRRHGSRVRNDPFCLPSESSTDLDYLSVGSSARSEDSGYADSETMSQMSDRSKDSPPYFSQEPMTSAIKKLIKAALKENMSSTVQVVGFATVVVALLYIVCSGSSGEKLIKQDVKIILPGSSAEENSPGVTEKLLKQIIKDLKQGAETMAHEGIQANKDSGEAPNNAEEMLMRRAVKIALQSSWGEDQGTVVKEKMLNQIIKELKQEVRTRIDAEIQAERGAGNEEGDGFIVSVIKWPFLAIASVINWLFAVIVSVVKLPFEIVMPVIWLLFEILVPVLKLLFLVFCGGLLFELSRDKEFNDFISRFFPSLKRTPSSVPQTNAVPKTKTRRTQM
ncbi:uncharacterized protein LOC131971137 [Centropristis striata]|uniref:uncharacterized protein LOC131971137 n=1 Tax=Centropristis striata TaxID=184440 RepID=UPI0027E06082|nr:uncharacterized protein LOC131971137 [Centropristis striata]XP_059188431.1 uncharacterized protein LOC131971137 [Centropristis striata]XP_059188432.1 uncharacterized protein LOC131971137 [Centropristis striata]XP_059188433.1 uncharacterized protein LOC131971137 [Centropristis striata]